jgi:GntR family transcriptional regulator
MVRSEVRVQKTSEAGVRAPHLDRRSGIPLYHQIQQHLLRQIESGELPPGTPMPAIDKIARRMGVSLMTVRQAVRALSEMGVVYSRQGKGTFICGTKLERDFRQVLSFTEESAARGAVPSSRVLSFEEQDPTEDDREALRLSPGERVYCLRRVRYGDTVPMGIESSCLPVRLCPGLPEKFNPGGSLYETLAEHYGIQLMITDEVVEVGVAGAAEARQLEVAPRSPVFLFTRTSYLEDGTPVEHVKSVYPGDRYKIVNRLMRFKRIRV